MALNEASGTELARCKVSSLDLIKFLVQSLKSNRPSLSYLVCLCVILSPHVIPFIWMWVLFDWKGNCWWTHFHLNEWFCTKTNFDKKAKGDWEMAYSSLIGGQSLKQAYCDILCIGYQYSGPIPHSPPFPFPPPPSPSLFPLPHPPSPSPLLGGGAYVLEKCWHVHSFNMFILYLMKYLSERVLSIEFYWLSINKNQSKYVFHPFFFLCIDNDIIYHY